MPSNKVKAGTARPLQGSLFFDGVLAGLVIRVGDHCPATFNNALLVRSWSQCFVSVVKCVGRSRSSRFTHGTALRKEFRGTDEQ